MELLDPGKAEKGSHGTPFNDKAAINYKHGMGR